MTAIHTFSDYLEPEALILSFRYFFRLADFWHNLMRFDCHVIDHIIL